MAKSVILVGVDERDEYNFAVGDVVHARMGVDGRLRGESWRDRWASAIAETLWPCSVATVTIVDADRGVITLAAHRG